MSVLAWEYIDLVDCLKLYYDDLLALCGPSEKPIAQSLVQYQAGDEEIGPRHDGVAFDPINGLHVDKWNRAVELLVAGRSLIAPHGGIAIELRNSVDLQSELLLTDQRLIVLDGKSGAGDLATKWSCSLEPIMFIKLHPRIMQAGRLFNGFTDGSAIGLMVGIVRKKKA